MRNLFLAATCLLILSSCKKDKLDKFSVVYEVEFISTWSASTHPTDFPGNAHFSPFIATSHLSSVAVFFEGLAASDGLKSVAETGNTDLIDEEFQVMINLGQALDKVIGNSFDSPGNSGKFQLGMKEGYHYATVISMIAPSPDWFVATTTSLLDPVDGLWYDEVTSHVLSYDAGTDSGASFTSADLATDPVAPISYLDMGPLTEGTDTVVNMGYFKFTRIK